MHKLKQVRRQAPAPKAGDAARQSLTASTAHHDDSDDGAQTPQLPSVHSLPPSSVMKRSAQKVKSSRRAAPIVDSEMPELEPVPQPVAAPAQVLKKTKGYTKKDEVGSTQPSAAAAASSTSVAPADAVLQAVQKMSSSLTSSMRTMMEANERHSLMIMNLMATHVITPAATAAASSSASTQPQQSSIPQTNPYNINPLLHGRGLSTLQRISTTDASASAVDPFPFSSPFSDEEESDDANHESGPPMYQCVTLPGYGRSLVAIRDIPQQESILSDTPLVLSQFQTNCSQVIACGYCGRFVKGLKEQLERLCQPATMHAAPSASATAVSSSSSSIPSSLTAAPIVIPSLPCVSERAAYLHGSFSCTNFARGCREVYCSAAHRQSAWDDGHALVCDGAELPKAMKNGSSSSSSSNSRASTSTTILSPYQRFCEHASRHHEFFIFAGKIVASIIWKIRSGANEKDTLAPYTVFVQEKWWKIVNPEGGDAKEEEDDSKSKKRKRQQTSAADVTNNKKQKLTTQKSNTKNDADESSDIASPSAASVTVHLKSVVGRSYDLLCEALFSSHSKSIPAWFTRDWYARLIGCLRLNALAVEHSNPLADYFEMVDAKVKAVETEKREMRKRMKMKKKEQEENEEEEEEEEEEEDDSGEETSSEEESEEEESDEDNKDDTIDDAMDTSDIDTTKDTKLSLQELNMESASLTSPLLPIIERIMSTRALDRQARRQRRIELAKSESKAHGRRSGRGDITTDSHSRVRPLERDSTPLQKYKWTREYTSSQRVTCKFTNRLFPSYHGSALYPIIAQMNHSCVPNAIVHHTSDARGHVYSLREIKKGEQIFISYINEDQDLDGREEDLEEYAFECKCDKCEAEKLTEVIQGDWDDGEDDDGEDEDEDEEEE